MTSNSATASEGLYFKHAEWIRSPYFSSFDPVPGIHELSRFSQKLFSSHRQAMSRRFLSGLASYVKFAAHFNAKRQIVADDILVQIIAQEFHREYYGNIFFT